MHDVGKAMTVFCGGSQIREVMVVFCGRQVFWREVTGVSRFETNNNSVTPTQAQTALGRGAVDFRALSQYPASSESKS